MGRKRKDITAVQAEFPDVLVLKYEGSTRVTFVGRCGHIRTTSTDHLRNGDGCSSCGSKKEDLTIKFMRLRQAFPLLEILTCTNGGMYYGPTATVKYQCGHIETLPQHKLQNVMRCSRRMCKYNVVGIQEQFPDVLVLKYENSKAITVKGQCGCVWTTEAGSLRKGQRCSSCAPHGYSQGKPGWLYFMERPGEMQVGISNDPERRLQEHTRNGWQLIEMDGPHDGATIFSREKAIRTYLRDADLLIDGTLENWPTTSWEPSSLAVIERIAA